MMMVLRLVVVGGAMTLHAERIAGGLEFEAVRLVAIEAGHTGAMHFTLRERAELKYFVIDLSIGVVKPALDQAGQIIVEESFFRAWCCRQWLAARVAGKAVFGCMSCSRNIAMRRGNALLRRIEAPVDSCAA